MQNIYRVPFLAIFLVAVAAFASAGTVSITSPSSTTTSPVHVVASASSSNSITSIKIYLDGNSVYSKSSATSIDTSISTSAGSHQLTVRAWDSSGTSFSSSKSISVTSTSSGSTTSSNGTVSSKIEEMSGWGSCTGCSGAGSNASYSMTQHLSSPSQDGNSTKFWVGGTDSFSHGLWWRRMSSNTSATHFVLDMYYYMPNPSASWGLEFAANQGLSSGWYKFSTQCSFGSSAWRVWDSKNGGWVSTGIACTRPPANTWQHVVFEYARQSGKAVFVSITVNGTKHYVNKSFYPQNQSSSGSVGIHFQLNGDSSMSSYSVYTDQMKLTYW